MWVKICANTSLEDARMAAEAGADAVGFVFAPSRRQVTPEQVAEISAALPPGVERVGVFAGADADGIARAAHTAGLTGVQLHGGLDPRLAAQLRALLAPHVTLIHTLHWGVKDQARSEREVEAALHHAEAVPAKDRLLLDAKAGSISGGLGIGYDWNAAGRVLRGAGTRPVIVAGGLTPETVAQAVRVMRPYGVDVASGVEREPGRKDPRKVALFVKNARLAS